MTSTKTNTFKCNVDNIFYKIKPEGNKIGGIVNRMKCQDGIKEMTAKQLSDLISQGYSFTTAVLNGKSEENFISQWLVVLDIDNEADEILLGKQNSQILAEWRRADPVNREKLPLPAELEKKELFPEEKTQITTVADAIDILETHNIAYSFIYHSFSHSTSKPKFRIVCILSEPITEPEEARRVNQYLISLFPQADQGCFNLDRIYFGTNKGLASEVFDRATDIIIPDGWQPESEQEQSTEPPISEDKEYAPPKKEQETFNLTEAIRTFNLFDYVEHTTGIQGKKHGKDFLFNPCPICGHKDDFYIDSGNISLFLCFSTHNPTGNRTGGNIINYLELKHGYTRKEAREYFIYNILKIDKEKESADYKKTKKQEKYNTIKDKAPKNKKLIDRLIER